MNSRAIVVYCGLLLALSAFSVDITLPSFPVIEAALAAPEGTVPLTVTVYIFSLGIGQLFWGAICDRYGRRGSIAIGLSVFLAGSVMTIAAPAIGWLLAGRFVQGIGGAVAPVAARAIIRDLFEGSELARNLATATAIFAIGPLVAPLTGVGIAAIAGWRFIFAAMALLSAILLAALAFLPETHKTPTREATDPAVFWRRTRRILLHPQSAYFLALSAVIMTSMILILGASPAIFESNFGVTGTYFAVLFAAHGLGIIVGQIANRRLIVRFGTGRALIAGNCVLVFTSVCIIALAASGLANALALAALIVLFATSYLIVYSNSAALVLQPHGDIAGHTASIYGFTSQIVSAGVVSLLIFQVQDNLMRFGAALLAICGLCLAAAAWWVGSRALQE